MCVWGGSLSIYNRNKNGTDHNSETKLELQNHGRAIEHFSIMVGTLMHFMQYALHTFRLNQNKSLRVRQILCEFLSVSLPLACMLCLFR